MKKPIRFQHCYDYHGEYDGPAIIDGETIIGVYVSWFTDPKTHKPSATLCVVIEYGPGHSLYVIESLEEVLWKLDILA